MKRRTPRTPAPDQGGAGGSVDGTAGVGASSTATVAVEGSASDADS
ncbi:hypothetical protein ACFCZY_27415 [Streptomyces sp. NPDC056237]